jgi:hypothetical protein
MNPAQIMQALGMDAARLDEIQRLLQEASDLMNAAEERWDECYDGIAEDLKDELVKAGSTKDPSEHRIVSETRRKHRDAYVNYRRAKRAVDTLERRLQAVRAAMNGRQSLLASMRDEAQGNAAQFARPRNVA